MVQFVFTPWRNRAELLKVRSQFYPSDTITSASTTAYTPSDLRAIQKAIARVFMWVHRGHCPHVVESTAMLMSAVVLDRKLYHHHHHHSTSTTNSANDGEGEGEGEGDGAGEEEGDDDDDDDAASDYGVRAAYLTAFTRFVTGLLDGHQDKARKLSMYGVAKTVGLPTGFVELRHQGTHEAMPGLAQLRPAAGRALGWIWEYYWRNLPGGGGEGEDEEDEEDDHDDDDAGEGGHGQGGGAGGAGFLAAAAATVTAVGGEGGPAGIRERMCRRALAGYLARQDGGEEAAAAREALTRQLGQWGDALVVRVLADMGRAARDGGVLARSVRLSREVLGRAAGGEGVQGQGGGAEAGPGGGVEEMREELARASRELESARESGKRKRAVDDDNGPGWKRWDGPWAPRPIGTL